MAVAEDVRIPLFSDKPDHHWYTLFTHPSMSWFGKSDPTSELDSKINEATSESIPNGELDIAVALEITDLIRSKKVAPRLCMRALKKRLINVHPNPNLLSSTLKLVDLCVKNGGLHFLVELASKEFIDYLVDYIFKVHYNTKDYKIYELEAKMNAGNLILRLLKEWSFFFENQLQLSYVGKTYQLLLSQGYEFPDVDDLVGQFSTQFIDSEAPPDWIDSEECLICYNAFTVVNRKHHCRSCGGVFCQTHSSHNVPLVHLGILEPVRVCDNCYEKVKAKNAGNLQKVHKKSRSRSAPAGDDNEDEQLRKAIELSLKDSQQYQPPQVAPPPPTAPSSGPDEEDEELKAAIAASLKEFENQERQYGGQQAGLLAPPAQKVPQSDLYSNILPFESQPAEFLVPQASFQQSQQSQSSFHQSQGPFQQQGQLAPPKQVEDLTSQEEDAINLFITLMNGIKSDGQKQRNILYDIKLDELHNKVVQLKPKLNKSLRASIEKYDKFLELNNKILTITRLYDQFLESKLNQAYNNHYISPNAQYGQLGALAPGMGQQHRIPQQQSGISHQPSGNQGTPSYYPSSVSQQNTGQQLAPQHTPYPVESRNQYYNEPSKPQDDYNTNYPVQSQVPPTSFYPAYPPEDSESEKEPQSDYSQQQSASEGGPRPESAPSGPEFSQNSQYPSYPPSVNVHRGSYPSYPPEEEEEEETEAVADRYPAVSAQYDDHTTANLNGDVKPAGARYPPIERVELSFDKEHPFPNKTLPNMPSMLRLDSQKLRVSEPEPLIEL